MKKKRDIVLHYGDITDSSSLNQILQKTKPHEIYNLAAQSHVHTSFLMPDYTSQVNAIGCLKLLESVMRICPNAKFYQASTSELYGDNKIVPQNENSKFIPNSHIQYQNYFHLTS